jgi:iron complex outermembrane receptor protein
MFTLKLRKRTALLVSAAVLPLLYGQSALAQAGQPANSSSTANASASSAGGSVQEVVVTATRRAEAISKVPESITAYTEQKLDKQGVKTIDDITRLTPGLSRTVANSTNVLSIRGVASAVGTSTTGIYIDDTPIQSRALAFFYGTLYPSVFDLSRVEVLRGPQGTLFGAGSEGGTVRFIFPTPNFTTYSVFARGEVSSTQGGGPSYETGIAAGGPIIEDKLAFRADVFQRRDGGYIDFKTGTFNVLDPTGNVLGPKAVTFSPTSTVATDANWTETKSVRAALSWKPIPNLTITPSYYYQTAYTYDQTASFLSAGSNPGASQFTALQNLPSVDANHTVLPSFIPNHFPLTDSFSLPALKGDWDLGPVELVNNLSYFTRDSKLWTDFTLTEETSYANRHVPAPGDDSPSSYLDTQKNLDEEFRIQSTDPNARLKYVFGAFYSDERQESNQVVYPNFFTTAPTFLTGVANGPPFGPGTSAFVNYYGETLQNGYSYYGDLKTHDTQVAGFGQIDFKIIDNLTFTAGVRQAYFNLGLDAFYTGPSTNTNAPQGKACVPNTNPCVPVRVGQYAPGTGPFVPQSTVSSTEDSEVATTPKFALSYQWSPSDLVYASASKGFRPGGAQQLLPSTCNVQLAQYGYVNSQGIGTSPQSYNSDSLWSYEIGSKDTWLDGKVQTAASLYYIDWSDIQTSVRLSTCNQTLTANLGHATVKGGDLQVHYQVIPALGLDAVVGYTESSFSNAVVLNGSTVYANGSAVPGSPAPWQVTLSGQYNFDLPGDRQAYFRADYTYTSPQRPTNTTDPRTSAYVIGLEPVPMTQLVNARLGMMIKTVEFNIFANNLFNADPNLALTRSINQPVYTNFTFRPRTVGAQMVYRFN